MNDQMRTLGWALDSITSSLGIDRLAYGAFGVDDGFEDAFDGSYSTFADAAAGIAGVGLLAAEPRAKAGATLIEGEYYGMRLGAAIGRTIFGPRGLAPGVRIGRIAGRSSAYAAGIVGSFAAGYALGSAAKCAAETW